MKIEPGILVKSKAGRDKEHIYVAIRIDGEYVYAADGDARPLCRMKRKNRKHLQPITKMRLEQEPDDTAVRQIIRKYTRESDTAETP